MFAPSPNSWYHKVSALLQRVSKPLLSVRKEEKNFAIPASYSSEGEALTSFLVSEVAAGSKERGWLSPEWWHAELGHSVSGTRGRLQAGNRMMGQTFLGVTQGILTKKTRHSGPLLTTARVSRQVTFSCFFVQIRPLSKD